MKKKIVVICAVSMIAAAANRDYVKAESRTIRSNGNLAFGDGSQTAVYSSDIRHLKEELDRLFGEIPDYYNDCGNDSLIGEE